MEEIVWCVILHTFEVSINIMTLSDTQYHYSTAMSEITTSRKWWRIQFFMNNRWKFGALFVGGIKLITADLLWAHINSYWVCTGATELKMVCACHGIARRNWEIQGFFAAFLRLLHGKFSAIVQGWNCGVQKIFCTPVTERSVANVLSLAVLPTSTYVLVRVDNLVAFQFFKNSAILL